MNPRASIPATRSTPTAARAGRRGARRPRRRPAPSASSGVMSLNVTPGGGPVRDVPDQRQAASGQLGRTGPAAAAPAAAAPAASAGGPGRGHRRPVRRRLGCGRRAEVVTGDQRGRRPDAGRDRTPSSSPPCAPPGASVRLRAGPAPARCARRSAGSRSAHARPRAASRGRSRRSVPTTMPTNSASAMSRRVPAPRRNAPTKRMRATGSTRDDRGVDRAHQGLVDREVGLLGVGAARSGRVIPSVFSRTLSNTTTVS